MRFVHDSLDLNLSTIRVLRIQPDNAEDSLIRLDLFHVHRTYQKYSCLSCTWGIELPTHKVVMNRKEFEVRSQLWEFLRPARKLKIQNHLWIDAISLDQDNILERNHQVQQVAETYR
jgi:hypothetical protein